MARSRLMRHINAAFLVIGAAALAWMVHHIGLDRLRDGMAQVGAGFAALCAVHFTAIVVDSITLRACAGDPGQAIPLRSYVRVSLAGHAINEATPLGKLGEITKFTLLSEHLPTRRSAAALIVQNLVMGIANCALIAIAPLVAILALDVHGRVATVFLVTAGAFTVIGVVFVWLLYRGFGDLPFRLLRLLGFGDERVARWQASWERTETLWRDATGNRGRMRTAWLSQLASRAISIGENALILHFLGADNAIAIATISMASFQLIHWTTSFVPLQTGTAEGSAYVLFEKIGLAPHLGVVMELVRKVRRLAFIGIGVGLLGWSTFRQLASAPAAAPELDQSESTTAPSRSP
jgi:hypothetical protein